MDRLKFFGMLVLGLGVFAHAAEQKGGAAKIERMYVFGDSYSDIGEGYRDGNGPTAVAYLAARLGFKLEPSNTAKVRGKSLDYAVSGAQSGSGEGRPLPGGMMLGYGMKNQVADFAAKVQSKEIKFDPKKTLFFIAGGLNDSRLPDGTTATNEKEEIRTLYGLGARRFAVAMLPEAIPGFGVTGKRLNPSLKAIPEEMQAELTDIHISLSHWGLFFDEVLQQPEPYGITNTTDACAGRAIRSEDPTPCAWPETYYYYHSQHPSTATHKAVGEKLYAEVIGATGAPAQ
ncbi:SGNH/GDSL hydrolase family protein [Granulicella sp. dw_53]|uniref:SGNH/GDSL hydrolase family protein n=1 Tax=Granulicella sp. dw_53 TaxID=2719792 RepID=UPI001BD213D3|nr:SGNH/GDSL hydrolase family protein [Granulicella sp. dw_53]